MKQMQLELDFIFTVDFFCFIEKSLTLRVFHLLFRKSISKSKCRRLNKNLIAISIRVILTINSNNNNNNIRAHNITYYSQKFHRNAMYFRFSTTLCTNILRQR